MTVKKLKVMTVVGTRPEIIRLSRVICALELATDHIFVHTGQNHDYELNQVFFEDFGLPPPRHHLKAVGDTAAQTIGNVIAKTDALLEQEQPDAFLVLGDTNSCLAAISAKKRRIPVFHMEAGNRCFDQRVPEETNRRIVDHVADVNLTYSDIAREYLLLEGFPPDRLIKTGSPMLEVLTHCRAGIEASDVLKRLGLRERGLAIQAVGHDVLAEIKYPLEVAAMMGHQFAGQPEVVHGDTAVFAGAIVVAIGAPLEITIAQRAALAQGGLDFLDQGRISPGKV